MDGRQRVGMRRLVNVTLEQMAGGALAPHEAARLLHAAGVPLNVIGRIAASAVAPRGPQPVVMAGHDRGPALKAA